MAHDAVSADVPVSDHPPILDAEIVAVDGVPVDRAPAIPVAVSPRPPTPQPATRRSGVPMGLAIPGVITAAIVLGTVIRWLALSTEVARSNAAIGALLLVLVAAGAVALIAGTGAR